MLSSRVLVLVAAVAIVLTGCSDPELEISPSILHPPEQTESVLNPDLQPEVLDVVDAESTEAESRRLADALLELIDPDTVLDVADTAKVVPATDDDPAFFGMYRSISLDTTVDSLFLAESLAGLLDQSSWITQASSNEDNVFAATLTGGTPQQSWLLIISGDATVKGQAVVTLQFASPYLEQG